MARTAYGLKLEKRWATFCSQSHPTHLVYVSYTISSVSFPLYHSQLLMGHPFPPPPPAHRPKAWIFHLSQ